MQENWVTPDEAARVLKVHPASVRRWIAGGLIEAFRVGGGRKGVLRITREELDRFTRSQPTRASA